MQIKTVEPLTVLFIRQELTIPEVGSYGEKFSPVIMAAADQHRLEAAGPWIFVSYNLPKNGKDRYVVDFCLPVKEAGHFANGQVAVKALSSFSCACTTYTGKLRQLFTKGLSATCPGNHSGWPSIHWRKPGSLPFMDRPRFNRKPH